MMNLSEHDYHLLIFTITPPGYVYFLNKLFGKRYNTFFNQHLHTLDSYSVQNESSKVANYNYIKC